MNKSNLLQSITEHRKYEQGWVIRRVLTSKSTHLGTYLGHSASSVVLSLVLLVDEIQSCILNSFRVTYSCHMTTLEVNSYWDSWCLKRMRIFCLFNQVRIFCLFKLLELRRKQQKLTVFLKKSFILMANEDFGTLIA